MSAWRVSLKRRHEGYITLEEFASDRERLQKSTSACGVLFIDYLIRLRSFVASAWVGSRASGSWERYLLK